MRYSSPHLPVIPVQLMRPGIGQNASCTVGDFLRITSRLIFKGDVMFMLWI